MPIVVVLLDLKTSGPFKNIFFLSNILVVSGWALVSVVQKVYPQNLYLGTNVRDCAKGFGFPDK